MSRKSWIVVSVILLSMLAGGAAHAEVALTVSSTGNLIDSGDNPVAEGTQTIAVVDRDNDGLAGFGDLNNAPSDSFLFDSDDWIVSDYLDDKTWDEDTGVELGGVSFPALLSSDNFSFLLESDASGNGTAGVNPGDTFYLFYFPGLDVSAEQPGFDQEFGILDIGQVPDNGGGHTVTETDVADGLTADAFGTTASDPGGGGNEGPVTWTGGTDGTFTTDGNWDTGLAPEAGDEIIFTGNIQTTINVDIADTPAFPSITFDGSAGAFTLNGNSVGVEAAGSITNNAPNTQTFNIDVVANGTLNTDAASGDLIFQAGNEIALDGDYNVRGDSNTTLDADVTGTGNLIKHDAGTLSLGGSNTYNGETQINAGTVIAEGDVAIPDASDVFIAGSNGATLDVRNEDQAIGAITGGGTVELNGHILTTNIASDVSPAPTFSGDVNSGTLEKSGDGGFMLTGTVDGLTVSTGTVMVNNSGNDAIDDATVPTVNATLSFGSSETIAGLTDDGTGSGTVGISAASTLTLEVDGGDQTYTGSITGGGGLTKTGADTQTLVGDSNDYTGATRVKAGTLVVEGGGAIGDSSAVTVISEDTLELSGSGEAGANDETIGSLAGGGTVQLNDNTLTLTFTLPPGQDTAFTGTIDGDDDGGLTLDAADSATTFDLSNANLTYGGTTTIASGDILFPDGDIPGGLNNQAGFSTNGTIGGDVINSGTLGGNFTVQGRLVNRDGGALAPGNSIGTTTVNGSYTQESGSTLAIELDGSGDGGGTDSDSVDVNGDPGTATFESGSTISLSLVDGGGEVQADDAFDIVFAEGGLTGPDESAEAEGFADILEEEFASIDFTPELLMMGPDEILRLTAIAAGTDLAGIAEGYGANEDQLAVANAIDSLSTADPGNPFVEAMSDGDLTDDGERVLAALDAAGPQAYEPLRMITVENTRLLNASLGRYFSARRAGSPLLAMQGQASTNPSPMLASSSADPALLASAMEDSSGNSGSGSEQRDVPTAGYDTEGPGFGDTGWSVFARGVGIFQNQDHESDRLGYNADAGGGLMGIDRQITPDLAAGLSLGYLHTDSDLARNRGDHKIDTLRVGPYLSYSPEPWFVDGALTYGYHNFESTRNNPSAGLAAESEHDGHDLSAYARAGYDIDVSGSGLIVTPEGSLQYLHLYEEAYTESGGGALDVDSRDSDSLRSRIGVSFREAFEAEAITLIPEFFIGWEHEFLGEDEEIEARYVNGGNTFTTGVAAPTENSAYFSAGMTALFSRDISAYVRYDGNYYADGTSHGITGGIRLNF